MSFRFVIGALVLSSAVYAGDESFTPLLPEINPNYAPATDSDSKTEGGLWMLMDKAEEELTHSPLRLFDPALESYLKGVVCELAQDYCEAIRVYVLRSPHFNATMAPNGMMQVWTGLLLRTRNLSQLAAVLGHELGHYLRRHSLKRFKDVKMKANISTLVGLALSGTVAAGGVSANTASVGNVLTQFTLLASIFSYSRAHEYEADQYGIQLLSETGLDTSESANIWRNLITEEEAALHKKNKGSFFFSAHPSPENRIEKLEKYARLLTKEGDSNNGAPEFDYYQDVVSPYMNMFLADELNLHQFGRSEFLFKSLIDDGIAPGLVHFYLGELYRIRNGDGDPELAKENYLLATEYAEHMAEAHRSLGLMFLQSKDYSTARRYFSEYLQRKPDASDKQMIEYYMSMGG